MHFLNWGMSSCAIQWLYISVCSTWSPKLLWLPPHDSPSIKLIFPELYLSTSIRESYCSIPVSHFFIYSNTSQCRDGSTPRAASCQNDVVTPTLGLDKLFLFFSYLLFYSQKLYPIILFNQLSHYYFILRIILNYSIFSNFNSWIWPE